MVTDYTSDNQENPEYTLPEGFQFLTPKMVRERLKANEDVVKLSIEKWERIYEIINWFETRMLPGKYVHNIRKEEHLGELSCALCVVSRQQVPLDEKTEIRVSKCAPCPLGQVDRCIDEHSVYSKIDAELKWLEQVVTNKEPIYELQGLILTMIKNLRSIEPEPPSEPNP